MIGCRCGRVASDAHSSALLPSISQALRSASADLVVAGDVSRVDVRDNEDLASSRGSVDHPWRAIGGRCGRMDESRGGDVVTRKNLARLGNVSRSCWQNPQSAPQPGQGPRVFRCRPVLPPPPAPSTGNAGPCRIRCEGPFGQQAVQPPLLPTVQRSRRRWSTGCRDASDLVWLTLFDHAKTW
jgi:hypothetical protein